jgi:NAD(P) transhydrogenase subunit beta
MPTGLVTISYLVAAVLFILALGGLSRQETARRGNLYGIIGMGLALFATVFGVVTANYLILFAGIVIGGALGLMLARRVQMTQMPELVAILHSLVGLAAVLVGFANFLDPSPLTGVERTIHGVETWLGVLIGAHAVGSVIASGSERQRSRQAADAAGTAWQPSGLLVAPGRQSFLISRLGGGLMPARHHRGCAVRRAHGVAIGGADMPS